MSLVVGIQPGIHSGVRRGVNNDPLHDQSFPTTAATLAPYVLGYTATNIYTHSQTSGNSVDHVAGANLTPQGTPTLGVVTGFLNGDRAARMADNTAQRLQASANTVFDQALDSFAFLSVINFGSVAPASTRFWVSKIGTAFYAARITAAGLPEFAVTDGATQRTATMTITHLDGLWHTAIVGVNRAAGLVVVGTEREVVTQTLTTVGSLANTGTFALGRSSVSAPQTVTYTARFIGAQAEGVLTNAAAVIARFFKGQP